MKKKIKKKLSAFSIEVFYLSCSVLYSFRFSFNKPETSAFVKVRKKKRRVGAPKRKRERETYCLFERKFLFQ